MSMAQLIRNVAVLLKANCGLDGEQHLEGYHVKGTVTLNCARGSLDFGVRGRLA